jgi:hypothetical protein
VTESSRQQYILRALADYKDSADPETVRLPLRTSKVLPVIEVPLNVPILNANSFRIAPQLAEHPKLDLVLASPESAEAQEVVAQLVRSAHRKADDLKENLLSEGGQTQPGVITRSGKLINANTRCVLLRELQRDGKGPTKTLRVAVLPAGINDQELLELEMVLQQQVELKDEYRLVSELMMIQRLFNENFTDEQIARTLRKKGKDVKESREILALMHRARGLPKDPLPLTAFDSTVDRRENWSELLRNVKTVDNREGHKAGDRHIKSWLIAYFARSNSVHKLRSAVDAWVEQDGLVEMLQDHEDLRSIFPDSRQGSDGPPEDAVHSEAGVMNGQTSLFEQHPTSATSSAPEDDAAAEVADDDELNLDLLGDDVAEPDPAVGDNVDTILNFVVTANKAGDEFIQLPNGTSIAATEALDTVGRGVEAALDSARRRKQAGGRLNRPLNELERARGALRSAVEALSPWPELLPVTLG